MQQPHRQKGVSLIEILVTLVVMAIGILGLMHFQGSLISFNDDIDERSQALILAQENTEEIRANSNYDNIITVSSQTLPYTPFSISWTITNNVAPNPEYKLISVNVTWQDRKAQNQSLMLTSIIDKYDRALEGECIVTPSGFLSPT